MPERYTNEELKEALAKARDIRLQAIDQLEVEHEFSARFNRKMNQLIKAESKPYFPLLNTQWKRIVAVLVVIIFLGITTVACVPVLRNRFYKMIEDIYEKYSRISFQIAPEDPLDIDPFIEYEISEVPDGFELVERTVIEEDHYVSVVYTSDGRDIVFHQMPMGDSRFSVNTEDTRLKAIYLSGVERYYLNDEKTRIIFWYDDRYVFIISAEVEEGQILSVAQGVKPIE